MNKSKGDFAGQKLKEIKNGRLAMVAFVGFAAQVRTPSWVLESAGDLNAVCLRKVHRMP